jgi:hypothetical protein
MLTKLKWLRAYFTREILPAAGVPVGKIFYTAKNTTSRRIQYVIDIDSGIATKQTINEFDINISNTTSPGASIEFTRIAPKTDTTLYIHGGLQLPIITILPSVLFDQTIVNGGTILPIDLEDFILVNGVNITNLTTTIIISSNGLTLTGSDVLLTDNTTAGTYTLELKVYSIDEPGQFVILNLSVTVEP